MSLLPESQIHDIQAAALRAGLDRDSLLGGISVTFVATLPRTSNASSNILSDLHEFNQVERLTDGTVPLLAWLNNARALASSRAESRVFQSAVALLSTPESIEESRTATPDSKTRAHTAKELFLMRMSYGMTALVMYVLTMSLFERGRDAFPWALLGAAIGFCGFQVFVWIIQCGTSVALASLKEDAKIGAMLRVSPGEYAAEMTSMAVFGIISPTLMFHFQWQPSDAGWMAALVSTVVHLGIRLAAWLGKTL